jgi:flagellar hook protein FlgE
MFGAIYTGLSGLNAYSKGLETVSNNVSNLNTPGFKTATVKFSDLSLTGGAGAPRQGGGTELSKPKLDFSQGELQVTDNDLDLAVDGPGFLVLRDDGKVFLSRTGQFEVNSDGYIAQVGSKRRLAGLDSSGRLTDFNIDANRILAPEVTSKIKFAQNLSSTATTATVADVPVYDSAGVQHLWTVKFTPVTGQAGEWTVAVTDKAGAAIGQGTIKFIGSTIDPAASSVTIVTTPAGAASLSVVLDFSEGVTSFSSGTISSLHASSSDGSAIGNLQGVTIDADGKAVIAYTNGKTESLGSVALMQVASPDRLVQAESGLYAAPDDARLSIRASGEPGGGKVLSRRAEASNVNLSEQFGELILIQRGFQACSQVVSISNDMIQQLFGIRGQG